MATTRTLQNNQLAKFILRIDIDKSVEFDYQKIVDSLTDKYSTKKVEFHEHFNLNIDEEHNHADVNRIRFPIYVMTNNDGVYLKLSTFDRCIVIESNKYRDNSIYKEKITDVIHAIVDMKGNEVGASRIELRYINIFSCDSPKNIGKIFNANDAKSIKDGLTKPNISRVLLVVETNENDHHIRVQYGVPNKFYPSIITRPDLMLDIDVFSLGLQTIDEWETIISSLNHEAYETFSQYVKASFIEKLR